MKLHNPNAEIFIPGNIDENRALSETTDLCIAAHQDDIEIMAFAPAAYCYGRADRHFTGVVVTDGAGSPRSGIYKEFSDEQMKSVRIREQNNAAALGDYSAQLQLAYKSADVKKACCTQLTDELAKIIRLCAPKNVFTHNLADKHDTHVSVALRVIEALRKLSPKERPQRVYSMEVWRSLDWLCDEDKVCFDTSQHPNLANALLGVYDSQIAGGKRYDSAAIGRRLANATFFASHDTDEYESLSYGLDITDLIYDENTSPQEFIASYIKKFENEVSERIKKLSI